MTVNINESRERLLNFLKHNRVGVMATASKSSRPHAAAVYLTFDKDLNIFFVTRKGTRKSQNLQDNNQVALAIHNTAEQTTLQVEGTAVAVNDPTTAQWVRNDIWTVATKASPNTTPPVMQLDGAGDYIVYRLSAPSLRLATYSQANTSNPEDIFAIVPTLGKEHFNAYGTNPDA